MGNWYSSPTVSIASGCRNARNDNMVNDSTLKKQRNAIKKLPVISALVRICTIINFICEPIIILAESY